MKGKRIVAIILALTITSLMNSLSMLFIVEAASQSEQIVAHAKYVADNTPHGYDGRCLAFCIACYRAAGYADLGSYSGAYEAGTNWIESTSSTNIPIGAMVFFDYSWNSSWGHVGIYAGNNKMYDAESDYGGVKLRTFKTNGYRGWGWYGRVAPNEFTDTSAPTISNVRVSDKSSSQFTIHCTLNDNVGVTRVWLNVYGPGGMTGYEVSASNGEFSHTISTSAHGGAGTYAVHIYAFDAAGNQTGYILESINANHTLTIYYDCYGSSPTIDTSQGFYLSDYNRICASSSDNPRQTAWGTENVYYITLQYGDTLGTYGLHNFSTFGLTAPTGYTFAGWRSGDNGVLLDETTQYTATDMTDEILDGDCDVWMTATFVPCSYTVVFNGNGATSGSMDNQTLTYDVAQMLNANAFRRSYTVCFNCNGGYHNGFRTITIQEESTFNGWAKSAAGAKVYNDRQSVINLATSGTVNLYANWTLGTVTFPTPTRTGYAFDGWYTDSALTTFAGAAGASYTPTENVTFYAKWIADTYSVHYNSNGATGGVTPANQTKIHNRTLTLADNAGSLVRTGYTLDGWATSPDGEKVYDLGGAYTENKNLTLYAHWTPNSYLIIFNGNGATSGSMANQTLTYDEADELTENAFCRQHTVVYDYNGATDGSSVRSNTADAVFNGWVQSSAALLVDDSAEYSAPNAKAGTVIRMYDIPAPFYRDDTYTLEFDADMTGEDGCSFNVFFYGYAGYRAVASSELSGAQSGFFQYISRSDGCVTITTTGTDKHYKIVFTLGGDADKAHESSAVIKRLLFRVDSEASTDVTIRNICFRKTGGQFTDKDTVVNLTCEADARIMLDADWTLGTVTLPTPTRTGYAFDGWYTDAALTAFAGAAGASYTPTADGTLYAKWTTNTYCLDINGSLDNVYTTSIEGYGLADVYIDGVCRASGVSDYYVRWDYGTSYEIRNIRPVTGHRYIGTNSALSGTVGSDEQNTPVTLRFATNSYSILYVDNAGGDIVPAGHPYVYYDNPQNKADRITSVTAEGNECVRPGYAFIGWNTEPDGSGLDFAPGDTITAKELVDALAEDPGDGGTLKLYAQWERNFISGDADEDGAITPQDVARMIRWLAGGWNEAINELSADINGDGVVNLKDAVLLRRYLAGDWSVKLN